MAKAPFDLSHVPNLEALHKILGIFMRSYTTKFVNEVLPDQHSSAHAFAVQHELKLGMRFALDAEGELSFFVPISQDNPGTPSPVVVSAIKKALESYTEEEIRPELGPSLAAWGKEHPDEVARVTTTMPVS